MLEGDDLIDETFTDNTVEVTQVALRDCAGLTIHDFTGRWGTIYDVCEWTYNLLDCHPPVLVENRLLLAEEGAPEILERHLWFEGIAPNGRQFKLVVAGVATVTRADTFDEIRWNPDWICLIRLLPVDRV